MPLIGWSAKVVGNIVNPKIKVLLPGNKVQRPTKGGSEKATDQQAGGPKKAALLREAQRQAKAACWLARTEANLPPGLLDLGAKGAVRVPVARRGTGVAAQARAKVAVRQARALARKSAGGSREGGGSGGGRGGTESTLKSANLAVVLYKP